MPTDPVTTAEDAIQAWVVTGSGLASDHVIWTGDGPSGPQPAGAYISMRITDDDTASDDWMTPRRNGSAIEYRVRSHHMATIELTCNAGASYGSGRAGMILRRVIAASSFPSVIEAMKVGGVGIGPVSKIRLIPGVRSGLLAPKAMVTVGVHMMLDIVEAGNEIVTAVLQTQTDVGMQTGTVTKP